MVFFPLDGSTVSICAEKSSGSPDIDPFRNPYRFPARSSFLFLLFSSGIPFSSESAFSHALSSSTEKPSSFSFAVRQSATFRSPKLGESSAVSSVNSRTSLLSEILNFFISSNELHPFRRPPVRSLASAANSVTPDTAQNIHILSRKQSHFISTILL